MWSRVCHYHALTYLYSTITCRCVVRGYCVTKQCRAATYWQRSCSYGSYVCMCLSANMQIYFIARNAVAWLGASRRCTRLCVVWASEFTAVLLSANRHTRAFCIFNKILVAPFAALVFKKTRVARDEESVTSLHKLQAALHENFIVPACII